MRITVDNTYYHDSVGLPVGLCKKAAQVLWPWALTFGMFIVLAVLWWKCY